MFSYIEGVVEEVLPEKGALVIDHNGMGFLIYVPERIFSEVHVNGAPVRIYTYFQVSENAMALYGFLSREERSLFELLITVNGVGPKAGVSILGTLSPDDLRYAILSDDEKSISKAPGVGAKTAKRIILDLKDKIDMSFISGGTTTGNDLSDPAALLEGDVFNEALMALIALGYSRSDAYKALGKLDVAAYDSTESLLKDALRQMM